MRTLEIGQVDKWLGNVAQLRRTIEHADRKADQLEELLATSTGEDTAVVFARASVR